MVNAWREASSAVKLQRGECGDSSHPIELIWDSPDRILHWNLPKVGKSTNSHARSANRACDRARDHREFRLPLRWP